MAEETKANEVTAIKDQGNECFKQGKFQAAIDFYSQALEIEPSAVLYCNRSFAHLKLENYGSAESDASAAIELEANFIKGYFRRGSAHYAMGKYSLAVKDIKAVVRIMPNDKVAREKLKLVTKADKEEKFRKAIESDHGPVDIRPEEIEVEESYDGPHFPEEITPEWVLSLAEHLKNQKKLHKKYVAMMLIRAKELFSSYDSLVHIEIPDEEEFTVCGDTHGQYYDLLNIFQINGQPSPKNPYLFNGDFVDRGSFSVEVILLMFAWKLCLPNHFHLTRGNHESKNLNKIYGFEGEVLAKYDSKIMDLFSEVFCQLPLSCVLNHQIIVLHGGLFSQDGVTLEDIRTQHRNREIPESGIMCELLWSDPCKMNGRQPSKRGTAIQFGPDIAHQFLDNNNLKILIRSHEMKEAGYEVEADGRVITIFSAPNYCDQMGNKGALIRLKGSEMIPKFTQFNAVPHPNVPVMSYAKPMFF